VAHAGPDEPPQVADGVDVEWELVEFVDPGAGSRDLLADDVGGKPAG